MNKSKNLLVGFVFVNLALFAIADRPAQAVELLINGDMESAVGPRDWMVQQTVTGLPGAGVSASEQISFANEPAPVAGELGIFLRPYAGDQGTYAGQNLPINYILEQTRPVSSLAVGNTFTFTGHSYFGGDADPETDDGFSGGVVNLDAASPSGPVPSPTDMTYELTFLNSSGAAIGTPATLELMADGQMNDGMWRMHSLESVAPTGTTQVRVRVAATNMVANVGFQDAFLDNFSLRRSGSPTAELLLNPGLNVPGEPNGWTITEEPAGTDTISFRDFANHTEGGEQGMWLRAFETQTPDGVGIMAQTVPGAAGGDYTFSAWSRWEANYGGGLPGTPTETFLKMEFLNASSAVIGTPLELDLLAAGQVADNEWRQFTLEAPAGGAPAGTQFVRVSAGATGMFFNTDPGQSAFFDDFSLDGPGVVGLAGDYNSDGIVDAADYVVWRKNPAGFGGDPAGYNTWRTNFGRTAGAGSGLGAGAVPEPASCLMAVLALCVGLGIRRRWL